MIVTVNEILVAADLSLGGRVIWPEPVPEKGAGVYVITIDDPTLLSRDELAGKDRAKWEPDQAIIYIGRSKHLARRLEQFYKHRYGDKRPHAGGQAILKISHPKHVHWASTLKYPEAEKALIEAFERKAGRKPFGNRCKSAQFKKVPPPSQALP